MKLAQPEELVLADVAYLDNRVVAHFSILVTLILCSCVNTLQDFTGLRIQASQSARNSLTSRVDVHVLVGAP